MDSSNGRAFSISYIYNTHIDTCTIHHTLIWLSNDYVNLPCDKYIHIIWNICLLCQFHPAPLKNTDGFLFRLRIFWPTRSNFSFTLASAKASANPKTQCSNNKKNGGCKASCASKILSVINQPQTTSGKNDDRCVGTRAFVSSSPRRRIAPSCPPSSDGSSNNPPANHFFKRRSSMEGWGSNIKFF